jgi:hypothetical protein
MAWTATVLAASPALKRISPLSPHIGCRASSLVQDEGALDPRKRAKHRGRRLRNAAATRCEQSMMLRS